MLVLRPHALRTSRDCVRAVRRTFVLGPLGQPVIVKFPFLIDGHDSPAIPDVAETPPLPGVREKGRPKEGSASAPNPTGAAIDNVVGLGLAQ